MEQLFLTRQEVAQRINVSVRTVDRWLAWGWLESVRMGTRILITLGSFERFLVRYVRPASL